MWAVNKEEVPRNEGEGWQLKNRDETGLSVPEVWCEVRNMYWVVHFSEVSYRPEEYSAKPTAPFCP